MLDWIGCELDGISDFFLDRVIDASFRLCASFIPSTGSLEKSHLSSDSKIFIFKVAIQHVYNEE